MLGALLGRLRSKAEIAERLIMYEELRRPRAEKVRDLSGGNLRIFDMLGCEGGGGGEGDGDGEIGSFSSSFRGRKGDDHWAEAGFQHWLFGHDCVEEAVRRRDERWKCERSPA